MADIQKDLYNKLWDNINLKDNRVWTFLSFYGAAIALVLGAKVPDEYLPIAVLFLVVFSFWAELFVLAAEWWGARNRLMILTIEDDSTGTAHNIPSFYREPRFTTDDIASASIWIVFSLQLLFSVMLLRDSANPQFVASVGIHDSPAFRMISTENSFLINCLQLFLIWLLAYPLDGRERKLLNFWNLVQDFVSQRRCDAVSPNHFDIDDKTFIRLRRQNIISYVHRTPLFLGALVIMAYDVTSPAVHDFAMFAVTLSGLFLVALLVSWIEIHRSEIDPETVPHSFMSRSGPPATAIANMVLVGMIVVGVFYF